MKFNKLKGFTLLEITIVVTIIGMLMVSFRSVFNFDEDGRIASGACVNNVYGGVNNYFYNALMSKSVLENEDIDQDFKYIIKFSTGSVELNYQTGDSSTGSIDSFDLGDNSSNKDSDIGCYGPKHYVKLSGDNDMSLEMRPGLEGNINQPGIYFTGDATSSDMTTGAVEFLHCDKEDKCQSLARLFIDTRVKTLRLQRCQKWTGDVSEDFRNCADY